MQVAVVEHFGRPLAQQKWAVPSPGPCEILVNSEACGVCHTDLHATTGDWPPKPKLPFIPGHEAMGRVAAVGAGVKFVKEGYRVGVPWLYSACGHCEHCLSAWEMVCADAEFGGYTRNGGFAEYVIADPNYVAHIPDGLEPTLAAPLICARVTTYKGSRRRGQGQASGSSFPASAVSETLLFNMRRSWVSRSAPSTSMTESSHWRRRWVPISSSTRCMANRKRWSKNAPAAARTAFITAPSFGAIKQGVGMTRKRGTCVLVGLPPGDFPVPFFDVVANCITIRGSFVGNREDMAETLAFAAEGKIKADIELQPLSASKDIFDRLKHGKVAGRIVLDFLKGKPADRQSEVPLSNEASVASVA
jgi:propanol-preferring alcohol dehydrogenase